MPTLYIVATPIGNLEDISIRALRILKEADLILAEDARVTKKLLNHYNINTQTLSYHQHSKLKKTNYIIELLKQGKNLALVSDAGTPGISDPGGKLIEAILQSYSQNKRSLILGVNHFPPRNKIKIISIPGPSAITAAASISGIAMDKFLFLGFPPAKRKRQKFFEEVLKSKHSVVFYESPHRILKTLNELQLNAKTCNLNPKVVVCRELTKKFETVYRGNIDEVIEGIKKDEIKGEFVVVVEADKRR